MATIRLRFIIILGSATFLSQPVAAQVRATADARSAIAFVPGSYVDDSTQPLASAQASHAYLGFGIDSTSSAFAYADLRTGKLGSSSSSNMYGQASSGAYLIESLMFSIPDALPNTVNQVTFNVGLDGILSQESAAPFTSGLSSFQYGINIGQYIRGNYVSGSGYGLNGTLNKEGFTSFSSSGGWTSSTFADQNGNGSGAFTFALIGPNPTLTLSTYLNTRTYQNAVADYSHTASLNLTVPKGVSWTSRSGLFLIDAVSSVPEPSTWMTMMLGLGTVGFAMRRRNGGSTTNVKFA